MVLWFLFSA
jgi:hypothetical protein